MATFFWSPMEDDAIDTWLVNRARQIHARVLPHRCKHNDYPPNTGSQGHWADIRSYDTIYICAHGVATSLSKIGWATRAGVVKWSAQQVSDILTANIKAAGRPTDMLLDFQLTACWGANRFSVLTESFGKTLSKKLKAAGFMGTLTAYQGATQLNQYGDYQIGSSRWTSALLHWKMTGVGNTPGLVNDEKRNRLGARVAYSRDDGSVSWTLA